MLDRGQTYHEWKAYEAYELGREARYDAAQAERARREKLWQGRNRSRTPPRESRESRESNDGTPEKVVPLIRPRRDPLLDLLE